MALAISVGVKPSFFRAAVSCRGVIGHIVASDGLRGYLSDDIRSSQALLMGEAMPLRG